MKIPYMVVVGEKEESTKTISVRNRKEGDIGSMSLAEFEKVLSKELEDKKIDRN
jgi:threonyl-tRNA synthetase